MMNPALLATLIELGVKAVTAVVDMAKAGGASPEQLAKLRGDIAVASALSDSAYDAELAKAKQT